MSAVTSPYGPTEMLSESVYNFAAASRRGTAGGGSTADQDSDSQQYDSQPGSATQLQLAASVQPQQTSPPPAAGSASKPRNKRKNFKPISSRMAEVSDESDEPRDERDERDDDAESEGRQPEPADERLDFEEAGPQLQQLQAKQRLNNNEVIPMDLSVAPRPPSFDGEEDDSGDSFGHKFILEGLRSQKLYSPGADARSPASESSDKSLGSGAQDEQDAADEDEPRRQQQQQQQRTSDEAENEADAEERRPSENMREYAESMMQELFAIYGLAGGELAKTVSRQLPPSCFLNPALGQQLQQQQQQQQHQQQQGSRVKVKEEKEASSMAPGSPPTPPHTPQSPSRQNHNSSSTSGGGGGGGGSNSVNNNSSSGTGGLVASLSSSSSPSVQQQQQQQQAAAVVAAAGLHPGSPLSQVLVQNPALVQLLQQNPAILTQNPQLAQLLQQNLQVQMGNALFQGRRADDGDEARVPPTIASLAAMKAEAADPKVSALLRQSMSPVSAEALLGSGAGGAIKAGAGGLAQPMIDYSRYVRRYSSGQECGSAYCKDLGCREHFHCLDCSGRVFVKKEEMIRHFKWHKKRDESLQHGFMRYSPTDDCSERHPGRQCPHNRKQTHYHCIHDNCDKVYISTSDVQMHANYHRKDSAIIQEGFQRFRATESCATDYCQFVGQRTTHFHCRRPGCRYTFKNKADMDKHKSYHIKDEQLSRDGFKKFMKSEACPFEQCRFSRVCNHIHCIRPQCSYVLHSSGQLFSHKRKHERNDSELAYRKYKQVGGGGGGVRGPGSWMNDGEMRGELGPQGLSLSLNGESSNEERGSPSYYSMDDSFQSASDLAMDLTAPASVGLPGALAAEARLEQPPQQLSPTELAYLVPAPADCSCALGKDHYHCALDRCGATLRDPREVREHLREHETQERITDAFFEEGGCDEASCPYADKEKHYHCNWDGCREVILATDKPFRRLQHYKIHEYSRQLNLSSASQPLSSDVTLTHLTNIDAMFRRKRGRPPKNRVIEIWSGGEQGGAGPHTQDSPQAIFTSFKLPKPTPSAAASSSALGLAPCPAAGPEAEREGSASPPGAEPVGFSTFAPGETRCYFQLLLPGRELRAALQQAPPLLAALLPLLHRPAGPAAHAQQGFPRQRRHPAGLRVLRPDDRLPAARLPQQPRQPALPLHAPGLRLLLRALLHDGPAREAAQRERRAARAPGAEAPHPREEPGGAHREPGRAEGRGAQQSRGRRQQDHGGEGGRHLLPGQRTAERTRTPGRHTIHASFRAPRAQPAGGVDELAHVAQRVLVVPHALRTRAELQPAVLQAEAQEPLPLQRLQPGILRARPSGGPHSQALDRRHPQPAAAAAAAAAAGSTRRAAAAAADVGAQPPAARAARVPRPALPAEARVHGAERPDGPEHPELPEPDAAADAEPAAAAVDGAQGHKARAQRPEPVVAEHQAGAAGAARGGQHADHGRPRERTAAAAAAAATGPGRGRAERPAGAAGLRARPQPRLPLPQPSGHGGHEPADSPDEPGAAAVPPAREHVRRGPGPHVRARPAARQLHAGRPGREPPGLAGRQPEPQAVALAAGLELARGQEAAAPPLDAHAQGRARARGLHPVPVQRGLQVPALRLPGAPDALPLHAPGLRLLVLRQDALRPAHGQARAAGHPDGRRLPAVPGQRALRQEPVRLHLVPGLDAEQGLALPLPQVRLCLHRHEQGRGPPAAARQARQHRRGRLPEVHAEPALRRGAVPALGQADPLPLPAVPVRGAGPRPDVGPQVPAHGRLARAGPALSAAASAEVR